MSLEYRFRCPLVNGLHARPASYLAEVAEQFTSRVTLINERTGAEADANSVLELVGAGIGADDSCKISVSGEDEEAALPVLIRYISEELPKHDTPLPEIADTCNASIPRLLANEEVSFFPGIPVSNGIGYGKIVHINGLTLPEGLVSQIAANTESEESKLSVALSDIQDTLANQLKSVLNSTEADILRAHLSIAKDVALSREMREMISHDHKTAAQAVVMAVENFSAKLNATSSAYLRERIVDLQDIGSQLLEAICGESFPQPNIILTERSIVVAKRLAPRQLLSLDRKYLSGLVLEDAGSTSHVVILARSFGIPTLSGIQNSVVLKSGQYAAIDAVRGLLIYPLTSAVRRFYDRELDRDRKRQAYTALCTKLPAKTADDRSIEVAANIATETEAEIAADNGAEGIGLFRTEMIFTERNNPPSEEEQFGIYKGVVERMNGRPVIIRTLDVGGDKPLAYLNLPHEDNPFLGYRGIRLYKDHENLINSQIRAIVRASAYGPTKIMAPMVSSLEEAQWFRDHIINVQKECTDSGIACDTKMQVGVMIEVPSAALIAGKMCGIVDFFSIGTNDLCQYYLAVDRGNQQVSKLYNECHPSFLRLLKTTVDEVHNNGKWIGMCGEMARSINELPLVVGLGLDEISLASPSIPAIKSAITDMEWKKCRQILESAITCSSASDVRNLLSEMGNSGRNKPLILPDLVKLDSDSRSKEEAIKELADMLYIAGRTDAPEHVEDAIWGREAIYSTGLGYGFAIPHCKTDSIKANSIGILKLKDPIEWQSIDGNPVKFVILLAIRESDKNNSHLRIFSKLARKLIDEDFRDILLNAESIEVILSSLASELEISDVCTE